MIVSRSLSLLGVALCCIPAPAQGEVVLPEGFQERPGNAGLSMPARWSQGVLQVLFEARATPKALAGKSLNALVFRRCSLPDEPPYPALTRTVTVRLTSTDWAALGQDVRANQPPGLTTVAGPVSLALPATQPHGPGAAHGGDLLVIPFAQPYVPTNAGLFVQATTSDPVAAVSPDHWADALYLPGGVDRSLVLALGRGGCGSGSAPLPMLLAATDATPPGNGGNLRARLSAAAADRPVWAFAQVEGDPRFPAGVGPVVPACRVWAFAWLAAAGRTGATGTWALDLPLPANANLSGLRVVLQAFVSDPAMGAPGLATSNGLLFFLDRLGLQGSAQMVLAPGANPTLSPWPPWTWTVPILVFRHS